MGLHAVEEVLKHAPQRLLKVFTDHSDQKGKRKAAILRECEKRGVDVQMISSDLLSKMTGSESHQSFAAHVQGRHFYKSAKDYLQKYTEKKSLFILMLDEIHDPQNFGALLRSAECFGTDAIVWSKNRGCDLTPTVAKASCGASELIDLIRVSNLAECAEQFKREGFEIVAALADSQAQSLFDTSYASRTVLIVGSEGEGIQPLLRKKADRSIFIPIAGKIESLNVAQAAAIFLAWKEAVSQDR